MEPNQHRAADIFGDFFYSGHATHSDGKQSILYARAMALVED